MFGLSTLQIGAMAALVAALFASTWFAARQTEALGEAKANQTWLAGEVDSQRAQTTAALDEIARRDELLAGVETERDALARRKSQVVTKIREVVVNDPDVAQCGAAAMPGSMLGLVRGYAAGREDDRAAGGDAAGESDRRGS